MDYKYIIDLDDHKGSGITGKFRYAENGELDEEMCWVQDGEGPHFFFNGHRYPNVQDAVK